MLGRCSPLSFLWEGVSFLHCFLRVSGVFFSLISYSLSCCVDGVHAWGFFFFFFFPNYFGLHVCRMSGPSCPSSIGLCRGRLFRDPSRHERGEGGEATSQIGFPLPLVIDLSVFTGLHLTGLLLQQCHRFCQFYFFLFYPVSGGPSPGGF